MPQSQFYCRNCSCVCISIFRLEPITLTCETHAGARTHTYPQTHGVCEAPAAAAVQCWREQGSSGSQRLELPEEAVTLAPALTRARPQKTPAAGATFEAVRGAERRRRRHPHRHSFSSAASIVSPSLFSLCLFSPPHPSFLSERRCRFLV